MLTRMIKYICLAPVILMLLPSSIFGAQILSVTTCESVVGDNWVPVNIRDSFTTQVPEINGVVKIDGVRAGTTIKGSWVSIDAINVPNYEIAAKEIEFDKEGPGTAHFSLSRPDNGWPPGNYKLDIYLDDQLASVKTFSITADAAPQQTQQKQPQYQPPPQQQPPPTQPQYQPPPQQQSQSNYGYSGTYAYSSQGVILTLVLNHRPSGELTGSLSSNTGVQYQVEGMVENNVGYGACYDNQGGVFFETSLADGQLYFALIEPDANNMPDYSKMREFTLIKQTSGSMPLSPQQAPMQTRPSPPRSAPAPATGQPAIPGAQGAAPQTGSPSISASGHQGQTFRHPVGFSFWYPLGWTATMQQGGYLQMTPPNPGKVADGPTELYFIIGNNVAPEGIFTPDDPRIIEFLDQELKTVAPVLQHTGRSTPVNMTQGKGALLEWSGTGQNNVQILARAFVSIINGYGIALTGVGYKKEIESRDKDLRQIFASFGFGQGQNDPALIGSWELLKTTAITNQSAWETDWSRAQAVSETSSKITFQPDGTWIRNDKSHMLVGAGGIWLEDKSNKSSNGIWNAGEGLLYMLWEDNSYRECQYRLEQSGQGPQLRLICEKRGEVWQRQ